MIRLLLNYYRKSELTKLRDALEVALDYNQGMCCRWNSDCGECTNKRVCKDILNAIEHIDEKLSEDCGECTSKRVRKDILNAIEHLDEKLSEKYPTE